MAGRAEQGGTTRRTRAAAAPARLVTAGGWETILRGRPGAAFARWLSAWLQGRRWFGGKARARRRLAILDVVPMPCGELGASLLLVEVRYRQGRAEIYAVPVVFSDGPRAEAILARAPGAEVARLQAGGRAGVLYAAEADPDFARALLTVVADGLRLPGRRGSLVGWRAGDPGRPGWGAEGLEPRLLSAEQSNTSIRFGDQLILKLFRRTEAGPNPDLEVGAYLTGPAGFRNTPPVLGGIEYRPRRGQPWSLGILQGFVPNQGDAWRFTLEAIEGYLERVQARAVGPAPASEDGLRLLDLAARAPAPALSALVGPYLEAAGLLGRRTAELHLALAAHPELPAFAPEPFTLRARHALRARFRSQVKEVLQLLRRRRATLSGEVGAQADRILAREGEIVARGDWLGDRPLSALLTRTHGDYHLGQVLWTGQDFMIIDFEGEPARPLSERRARASPLRDVAGMLRSFQYAAQQGLAAHRGGGLLPAGLEAAAVAWMRAWQQAVSGAFLAGYLAAGRGAAFLPADEEELEGLLDLFLLEKAVYELGYELNNRPDWIGLPLHGIAERLGPDRRT